MMDIHNPRVLARFWAKVQRSENGCWLWTGHASKGYGSFMVQRKNVRASRFSYELHKGPIGDLYVCHRCDNPTCVNPDHLFLGTAKDNLDDAIRKGRFPVPRDMVKVRAAIEATGTWFQSGERHPSAKLNAEAVREIRRLCAAGVSQWEMARRFDVGPKTINHIVHRRTWAHVASDPVEEITSCSDGAAKPRRQRPKCDQCQKYVHPGTVRCAACASDTAIAKRREMFEGMKRTLASHGMVER